MKKEYEVISIDELTRPSPLGGIEKFYRHSILTKGGTRKTVEISEEDFTPLKAAPILLAAAKNADAIKALGG